MFKEIKSRLTVLIASILFLMPIAVPATVAAAAAASITDCTGIENCITAGADKTGSADSGTADEKVTNIIKLVINTFSWVVGIISVIMIIIGGLKYITSGGEGTNITGAKNTILYAIIGLVVVALAQIVVQFVLSNVTATSNL